MAIYADGVDRRVYDLFANGSWKSRRLIRVDFVQRVHAEAIKRKRDIVYVEVKL